jgi:hypothetical protein
MQTDARQRRLDGMVVRRIYQCAGTPAAVLAPLVVPATFRHSVAQRRQASAHDFITASSYLSQIAAHESQMVAQARQTGP